MFWDRFKRFLELSLSLAKYEFKLRNEGSFLGIFWYLLNPLLLFGLLFFIFSIKLGSEIESYGLYLFLGIIMFNFFQAVTIESTRSIRDHRYIIKSINFPRESMIASNVLKFLFSHIFEIIAFLLFILFFGGSLINIIFYPLVLIFLSFFILGASFILGAFAVYFVDLENIWLFVSRLLWFGTPILYSVNERSVLFFVNLFNPMYYFIGVARDLVVYSKIPELWMLVGAVGYSLLFLIVGIFIFSKLKNKFAEVI